MTEYRRQLSPPRSLSELEVAQFPAQELVIHEHNGIECGLLCVHDEMIGKGHFITPLFFDDFFAGPVNYVPDVEARYAEAIKQTDDGEMSINGLPKLPRFKSQDWAFQEEYRFHLFVLPTSHMDAGPDGNVFKGEAAKDIGTGFRKNIDPGINFVDVPMAEEALENLVVRLGPLATPGGRLCVEALLDKYAPNAKLEDSHLTGTVRPKTG